MSKRAVCIGLNDYPGSHNDLRGCVNDARAWAGLLRDTFEFGDDITSLTDVEATRENVLSALSDLITTAKAGDIVVFTFSGHGSWVYDRPDGDEADNRDETICAHDGDILDDELREVIRQIDREARLTVISDTCHSGSVTRTMLKRAREDDPTASSEEPRRRYMPPPNDLDAIRTEMIPIRRRMFYPECDMPELLITGCNATEYSYDAYIGGQFNGAMTAMATRVIKAAPKQTYREFHRALRKLLPSARFPQSPQLEGSDANKDRPLFS